MTAIVGVRCKDGVVIGADSAATFGDGGKLRTMEQLTEKKIEIIGDQIIVAGTGYVGHLQRFNEVVKAQFNDKAFMGKSGIEIGKMLSSAGIRDFRDTHLQHIEFSAFVAFPSNGAPTLCELPGGLGAFQPEIKDPSDLWFTSAGSGQPITDPFLAFFREVFWPKGPPSLQGGIFTALWALLHACEVNPGGVKAPIHLAVLASDKGKLRARMLSRDELAEHEDMVKSATAHFSQFREILEGKVGAAKVPTPPPAPGG